MPPPSKGNTTVLQIIPIIIERFFKSELDRQEELIKNLIKKNSREKGGSDVGFIYGTERYFVEKDPRVRGAKLSLIHPDLADDAGIVALMRRNLEKDRQKLRQSLSVVLSRCQSKQDVRDALPDVLGLEVDFVRGLKRTRQPEDLLQGEPMLQAQFHTVLDIVNKYAASKLVFT